MEYLIPTNNIIVLDSYFNVDEKYNLDLIRVFNRLVAAYFLGHPVYALSVNCI